MDFYEKRSYNVLGFLLRESFLMFYDCVCSQYYDSYTVYGFEWIGENDEETRFLF